MKNRFTGVRRAAWYVGVLFALLTLASGVTHAQSAAKTAADAAKKICAGKTITIVWEAGLQSLDPLNFSGPLWEKETGCKVKVVEVPTAEMFTKIMQEYRAGTGSYDALNVIPAWMPDLVQAGALEQLDKYVDKYGFRAELQKIAPTYRDNQMTVNGKIYGFPDDGDVFIMYYRKDIFARADLKKDFAAKYNYELMPPKTWKQFDEIGSYLTEKLKGEGRAVNEKKAEEWLIDKLFTQKKITSATAASSGIAALAGFASAMQALPFPVNISTAPGVAAAAGATASGIGAVAAGAASLAIGTDYVPMDGLAYLHKGEKVIPASMQGPGYSGGGGITIVVNHSVSAVDAASFQGHIRRHGNMIANEVTRALKRKGVR